MARTRLGDLCARSVSSFKPTLWHEETFVYIDVSSIDVATKTITNPKRVAVADAPSRAQTIVSAGDILVSNVRPNLNAVARVTPDLAGAVCSSAFSVLRCNSGLIPDYLFCFVQSPAFIEELSALAHGAHYPAVTDRQVFGAEIELPAVDEQISVARQILEGLSAARSALTSCVEQEALSDSLTARILADVFHGEVPLIANTSGSQAIDGWHWHHLTDLARLESGHTPSRRRPEWWGGDVPWLALPDIRKLHGKYAYETTENTNDTGIVNSSARLLPVGTVCLCRDASIGYVTILGRPMATSQHFCNWICDPEKLDPEFLMYAFMASHDYLRELGSGSVLKTIYMPTIQSFRVCAPEIEEQRRIARTLNERLAATEALSTGLKAKLADIERLPQRLLAAAFA